jgi:toxin-antitoxin system PIN domain toxin
MTLLDVNVLVNAVNTDSADHTRMKTWLEARLQSQDVVALPWAVLKGFVRITTSPRILSKPLHLDVALRVVEDWLNLPNVRVLQPTDRHMNSFGAMCRAANATGNLVTDAHLAALATEHGCELASSDTDFAKFPGLRWINPLMP